MKGDASSIYKWVVDDVVAGMAPEFQAANIDESVLMELRQKWEDKLKQQGLIRDDNDAGDDIMAAQMHRGMGAGGGAYGGANDGEAGPSSYLGKRRAPDAPGLPANMAPNPALQHFLAVYTQTLQQQTLQLQQQQQQQLQQQQLQQQAQQQQQMYMLKQEQAQQQAQQQQQHAPPQHLPPQLTSQQAAGAQQQQQHYAYYPPGVIPQRDGEGDTPDGAGTSAPGEGAGEGEAAPEGDEVLSEDEHDENDDEEVVENLLIGQFEKVNKMKNRWKVAMRDCVFHINGRDFLFKKCNAEFSWS